MVGSVRFGSIRFGSVRFGSPSGESRTWDLGFIPCEQPSSDSAAAFLLLPMISYRYEVQKYLLRATSNHTVGPTNSPIQATKYMPEAVAYRYLLPLNLYGCSHTVFLAL